jgi:hypothetical protein
MRNLSVSARLFGTLSVLAGGTAASAATLVDYKPLPVSPTTPEFVFNGGANPSLQSGPGVIGNADGTLPVANQTPGGLDIETPFVIPGVPGSLINGTSGTTEFYDTTFVLSGLVANAPAVASGPILIQSLGNGSFTLFSTDPDGPGAQIPTLLLSGNITNNSFLVGTGTTAGEFNSLGVTYTGGLIYNALIAAGAPAAGNSMSISLLDVNPSLSVDGDGKLADFTANGTGSFSYVPEPASIALFGLAGAMLGIRRRRSS